ASPVGSAVGRGEIRGTGARATHLFQARWETSEPLALIRPIVSVPGALKGGRLSGSLTIQGRATEPVAHLDGDFTLARARYLPPGAGGSQLPAIPITELRGSFRKEGDRTKLTGVSLLSPALSAVGGVEFLPDNRGDGGMLVHSHLKVADLGRFLSYWPLLRKKIDGGSVTADLTLRGDVSEWSHTTGSGTLVARGGRFTIPEAEAPF